MCKGLTSASSVSIGGRGLKLSRENFNPLSFSTISWRTREFFSFQTPSNLGRGDCGHNGTNGLKDGRDANVH
jgi:hypothetical protein